MSDPLIHENIADVADPYPPMPIFESVLMPMQGKSSDKSLGHDAWLLLAFI